MPGTAPANESDAMMFPNAVPSESTPPTAGMPIGGVGTGSITLGRDSRFRAITINSNQTFLSSPASFLAIRAVSPHEAYIRILQTAPAAANQPPDAPDFLANNEVAWRGLFPTSDYILMDPQSPVRVGWSVFAPVIPFDHEAAILPVLLAAVKVFNPSEHPMEVSLLFNCENLTGGANADMTEQRAPIIPFLLEETENASIRLNPDPRSAPRDAETPEYAPRAGTPRFDALLFAPRIDDAPNWNGQCCLAAHHGENGKTTTRIWDCSDAEENQCFWEAFRERGGFGGTRPSFGNPSCGAVCVARTLPPHEEYTQHFVLAWYFPSCKVEHIERGNGYTNRYQDAVQIARHALKHVAYYHQSVRTWHARVQSSTLPEWFNTALIDSLKCFAANSLYDRDGRFLMYSHRLLRAEDGWANSMLYGLPAALLFPRFAHMELRQIAQRLDGTLIHGTQALPLREAAEFVLAVYREHAFTGHKAHLNILLPQVRQVIDALLRSDHNRDGLPDLGESASPPNACEAGLWMTALQAYALLAKAQGLKEDAALCEEAGRRAVNAFENRYWDASPGCYRLHGTSPSEESEGPAECLQALAGHAYAILLGIPPAAKPERVESALTYLEKTFVHAARPPLPPHRHEQIAWFVPLLMRYGRSETAMRLLETLHKELTEENERGLETSKGEPESAITLAAIWHGYYALLGFRYDAPGRELTLAPNTPGEIKNINAPILTSLCLGSLTFQEELGENYRQRIQIVFDSPLTIERLLLRVPETLVERNLSVHCSLAEQTLPCNYKLSRESRQQKLTISFTPQIMAVGALRCVVQQAPSR